MIMLTEFIIDTVGVANSENYQKSEMFEGWDPGSITLVTVRLVPPPPLISSLEGLSLLCRCRHYLVSGNGDLPQKK
jgi:hypothetical protein